MTHHEPGTAHICAVCCACLSIVLSAATALHAREDGADTTKIISLSPQTKAYIRPLIVMPSPENFAAATLAGATAGTPPVSEISGPEQTMNLDDGPSEDLAPSGDNRIMTGQAPPAPGRLFGSDEGDRLFGIRGGFIHPSLLFQEEWTDNLYNTDQGRQSNFLTLISPGIWLGFPRMEEAPLSFTLNNGAIGGHRFLVADSESFERFQAYLSGTADYKAYSANTDLNDTSWRLEGFGRYNMPAGLSLHVLDNFSADRDRFDQGSFQLQESPSAQQDLPDTPSPSFVRNYTSNLVNTALVYAMTDRYTVNFDYTNFYLVYDDNDSWLNRSDNNFALSLSYHFTPKTSFIAEYSYALVSYEQQDDNNSTNAIMYAGLDWQGSSRISLSARGGYQAKEFNNIDGADTGAFSMEGIFDYLISDKTKISFSTYKALEETNTLGERGMDTLAAKLRYEQRFSYRLRGGCELHYELNDHAGFASTDQAQAGEPRKDTTFSIRPSAEYLFRDWLTAELAYAYENRNSSDSLYNYYTQTITLGLNFAL
jgi:hypothetical protein